MSRSKAVIFTHIGESGARLDATGFKRFAKEMQPFFESCLQCKNIGIVYAYVSSCVEQEVIRPSHRSKSIVVRGKAVGEEQKLFAALNVAVAEARKKLARRRGRSGVRTKTPIIEFVGVARLVALLEKLMAISPKLVKMLAGHGGKYTYDSPKFVEAVIRIVRGVEPCFARDPVIRIDQDVLVNEQAIKLLLDRHRALINDNELFFFFSGSYRGSDPDDDLNQHAVRTHWLLGDDPSLPPEGKAFLCDLGELGATQLPRPCTNSRAGAALARRKNRQGMRRPSPQAISGAGLIMSLRAILRLPPFMNAGHGVLWIDDLLKRLLHEAIGDIADRDIERIPAAAARLLQSRPPGDIQWAERVYFERVLRGCLMHAMVMSPSGSPGPLSRHLKRAIEHGTAKLSKTDKINLRGMVERAGRVRFSEVLRVWSQADYGGATKNGVTILQCWARQLAKDPHKQRAILKGAVGDAMAYVDLFLQWKWYVDAILRLTKIDADWLFIEDC